MAAPSSEAVTIAMGATAAQTRPTRMPAAVGHADVAQDDVRAQRRDQRDGGNGVGRFTDDVEALGQVRSQPAAPDRVVVGDDDAKWAGYGSHRQTSVPRPGMDLISTRPSISLSRRRTEWRRPYPRAAKDSSKPHPASPTERSTPSAVG